MIILNSTLTCSMYSTNKNRCPPYSKYSLFFNQPLKKKILELQKLHLLEKNAHILYKKHFHVCTCERIFVLCVRETIHMLLHDHFMLFYLFIYFAKVILWKYMTKDNLKIYVKFN